MSEYLLDHQPYLIFFGGVLVILFGFFLDKKKHTKIFTFICAIIGAVGTLIFTLHSDKKQDEFQRALTGGKAHPFLLLWETPYFDKATADAYMLNFVLRAVGDNPINDVSFSVDDYYGAYMYQYFTVKAFHKSFGLYPHHYSIKKAFSDFNENFNILIRRLDTKTPERYYVATIPQNYNKIVVNKIPPPFEYNVYFDWTGGSIRMHLKLVQKGKHLALVGQEIWYNGQLTKTPDDFFNYEFQD